MQTIISLIQEDENARNIFTKIIDGTFQDDTRDGVIDALCRYILRHEKNEVKNCYPSLNRIRIKLKGIISHLITEKEAAKKDELTHIQQMHAFQKQQLKVHGLY